MSEAVSSVSSAQGAQQTQRMDQSASTAQSGKLEAPSASAVQAFNSNASTDAASSANGANDITANTSPVPPSGVDDLGDQTHVDVNEVHTGDGGLVIDIDNGRGKLELSVAEMEQMWKDYQASGAAPGNSSMDLVETPWGDQISGSQYKAFLNHIIDNQRVPQ